MLRVFHLINITTHLEGNECTGVRTGPKPPGGTTVNSIYEFSLGKSSAIKHKIIDLLYHPIEISEKLLSQQIFGQQILSIFNKGNAFALSLKHFYRTGIWFFVVPFSLIIKINSSHGGRKWLKPALKQVILGASKDNNLTYT